MSRGFNRVILMGNLAKDPDVKTIPSGQTVANITVAVGREWKDKSGEKQSHTDFVQCQAWGKLADIVGQYAAKGKPVLVEGRLSVRDFDDAKTGQHRWVTEVVLDNLTLLPGGNGQRQEHHGGSCGEASSPRGEARGDFPDGFANEFPMDFSEVQEEGGRNVDIPF